MTFHDKPYLHRLYLDQHDYIVLKKAVQMYCTEWAVCEALSLAERGYSVFYVLPKYSLRNTFVRNRIDPNLALVPHYKELVRKSRGDADSVAIKHFGSGTIKFVSSGTLSDFSEHPADAYIIDELDYCNQSNIAYAEDRLEASELKARRKLGNPTLENFGIDLEFEETDQKEWMVKCEHCGEWQELDFFKGVVRINDEGKYEPIDREWEPSLGRDMHFYCKKCSLPLDRMSEHSCWVSKRDSDRSGYHLHHLMRHPVSPEDYVVASVCAEFFESKNNPTKLQLFYNSKLGLAYEARGEGLSGTFWKEMLSEYELPEDIEDTVAGVDVGNVLHVVINYWPTDSDSLHVWCGVVDDFEELGRILKRYGVRSCAIDAAPETKKARELQQKLWNEVDIWLCYYVETARSNVLKEPQIDFSERVVKLDRTTSIDEMISHYIRNHSLPHQIQANEEYLKQMQVPKRVRDEVGGVTRWTKGVDHYFHAENYAYWAHALKGYGKLEIL